MSPAVTKAVRHMKAQTLSLIRCLNTRPDPELVPVVDALEDVYTRIVHLQAALRAYDQQTAYMEGLAAGVGLGEPTQP